MSHLNFFLLSIVILPSFQGMQAVEYDVTNEATSTAGGARFNNQIGLKYSKQVLGCATTFMHRLLQQDKPTDRKSVARVSLIIVETMDGISYTSDNEIQLSANYIGSYSGDVKREITGVLYHEMTHVWQWNGDGQAPGGLIEGIADFVRLKAGYAPGHWGKPGQGDQWDQGFDVTAYFLDYCNGLRNGFVAELNRKMRSDYNANYFVQLVGKTVDQLWKDYKAKYNN